MHVLVVSEQLSHHHLLTALARDALAGADVRTQRTLDDAITDARSRHAHLVLLDLALRGCSGIEALERFRGALPRVRVVVFSPSGDRVAIHAALRAGAEGCIPKGLDHRVAVAALRLIAEGGRYLPPEMLLDAQPMRVVVTARQREVLRLLLKGYSNQRIAAELDISQSTVKQHAHAVFDALGVSTRAQLIATAARGGIHTD